MFFFNSEALKPVLSFSTPSRLWRRVWFGFEKFSIVSGTFSVYNAIEVSGLCPISVSKQRGILSTLLDTIVTLLSR